MKSALSKYQRYLENLGFSDQTIESYLFRCRKYLEFTQTDQPSEDDFAKFRIYLQDKHLARNTMNNYGFATRKYHQMIGKPVDFYYLKPHDTVPFFFDENEMVHDTPLRQRAREAREKARRLSKDAKTLATIKGMNPEAEARQERAKDLVEQAQEFQKMARLEDISVR